MSFDPQKSREAHSQIGRVTDSPAAASSSSHRQDSPADVIAICAVNQPATRDERGVAGQPSSFGEVQFVTLGAAAAAVVAGLLALLQRQGVLR
jgi:hypothetical protein